MLTASQLLKKGIRPKTTSVTFDVREDQGTVENGRRIYTFPLPRTSNLTSRLDVGDFSTQSVEPNITTEENKVRWTEGLVITTGQHPSIISGGEGDGVPVFSHELAIVEGSGADARVFKVGVVPRFNEISRHYLVNDGNQPVKESNTSVPFEFTNSGTGHPQMLSTTSNHFENHRTYNHAAPHYGKIFQNFVAAGYVPDMKLDLACAVTTERIDCVNPSNIDFSAFDTSTASNMSDPISDAASTVFTMDETKITSSDPTAVTMQDIMNGFLVCSPWFINDIIDFMNFQLSTVVDSQFKADVAQTTWVGSQLNSCHTTNTRPSNGYRFEFAAGRVQLVRTSGSTSFSLVGNTSAFGNYAYHSVQDTVGDGSGSSTVLTGSIEAKNTCPTGHVARNNHSLFHALGFRQTAAGEFVQDYSVDFKGKRTTTTRYGLRASAEHAGIFETTIEPGFYSAQTLADSVSRSLNLQRNVGSDVDPNAPSAAFTFVDSTNVTRTAVITAGHRTPYQLAESLCFVLNRLDARGVYSQTRERFTTHDLDARYENREYRDEITASRRLLWYRVVFDRDTKKYTIENREIRSHKFAYRDSANPADSFPYPVADGTLANDPLSSSAGFPTVQYPTGAPVRAPFSLSFRAVDLQTGAATLGMAPSTATAARLLGFVPERRYTGTTLVSEHAANVSFYPSTLTLGMLNDSTLNTAHSQRPLDTASNHGQHFYHNQPYFRGSGPDADIFPRYVYSVTGSEVNDKQYTITARHPAAAESSRLVPARTSTMSIASVNVATEPTGSGGETAVSLTSASAGTHYTQGSLVVIDDSEDGGPVAYVSSVNKGAIDSDPSILYQGNGSTTFASPENAIQIVADGPLRIVDGHEPVNTYAATSNDGEDMSRIVVQCAMATEIPGVYRTTQGHLPFQVGDFVELGGNCSILLGTRNWGTEVGGHALNIQRVTGAGTVLQAETVLTASGANHDKIKAGQLYRVMQGDCGTVIRVRTTPPNATDTSYEFDIVEQGTGHYVDSAASLFGPIPPHITGLVEEVMQPCIRHEPTNLPNSFSAFASRKTWIDPSNATNSYTSSSLARDGSLLKIRLAYNCTYSHQATYNCQPSNLTYIRNMDPVRFQLVNHSIDVGNGFRRKDTVWNAMGLSAAGGDSAIGQTVKLPGQWNLNPVAGLVLTLENDIGFDETHEYFTGGKQTGRILAKIDYNAAVSRSWGVVHARPYTARNLREIKVRVLDSRLRDYDFGGRSFTITFNLQQW